MSITPTAELPRAITPPAPAELFLPAAPPVAAAPTSSATVAPTAIRTVACTASRRIRPLAIGLAAIVGVGGLAGGIRAVAGGGDESAAGHRDRTPDVTVDRQDSGGGGWFDMGTDTTVASKGESGHAAGSTLTDADLGDVYQFVFGLTADSGTLDCVAGEIDGQEDEIGRLVAGELLSNAEATDAFVPFLACASDADYVAGLVPAVTQVLGGSADQNCIADGLLSFGTTDRAALLALAYSDTASYTTFLSSSFAGCAI